MKMPNKIILVTGGCGFIGSNYLNICVPLYPDYMFVNIDALTYAGKKSNVKVSKAPNYAFEKVDLRNQKALEKIFKKYSPTHIINFAAESLVDFSIDSPQIFVETNVNGTHNLMMLAKKYGVKRFHQISTDEVYGCLNKKDPSFTENSPLLPNNPYSASKAGADCLLRSYHETYGFEVVITRCSNNYGPNQDTTKLIPKFIDMLLRNKKVTIHGDGSYIRDWIYIDDHVEAIDLVFHKAPSGGIYNIGGGLKAEKTNLEVTRILLKLLGKDESYITYVKNRPGQDIRYSIDSGKMLREFGWKAKTSFEDGIRKTIDFYKNSGKYPTPKLHLQHKAVVHATHREFSKGTRR